jgi:hypothetical protein
MVTEPALNVTNADYSQLHLPSLRVTIGSPHWTEQAHQYYRNLGFAILKWSGSLNDILLRDIATELGLGSAYIPPVYGHDPVGFSSSGVATLVHMQRGLHDGFSSTIEQPVHVDGTLDPIGEVHTTLLGCVSPAATGGDSVLFNAVAALQQVPMQRRFRIALLDERALLRTASIGGETAVGPVFGEVRGSLCTRFSIDATSRWQVEAVPNLRHALHILRCNALTSGRYSAHYQLHAGELLYIANSKIAHGRTAFTNSASKQRCYKRMIFK